MQNLDQNEKRKTKQKKRKILCKMMINGQFVEIEMFSVVLLNMDFVTN